MEKGGEVEKEEERDRLTGRQADRQETDRQRQK